MNHYANRSAGSLYCSLLDCTLWLAAAMMLAVPVALLAVDSSGPATKVPTHPRPPRVLSSFTPGRVIPSEKICTVAENN